MEAFLPLYLLGLTQRTGLIKLCSGILASRILNLLRLQMKRLKAREGKQLAQRFRVTYKEEEHPGVPST